MKTRTIPSYQEHLEQLKGNLTNMLPADALELFAADAEALQQQHTDILKLQVGEQVLTRRLLRVAP